MKLKFVISRLPHLEYVGDWHDKPLKWIASCNNARFTQKFSTKAEAQLWATCAHRTGDFKLAGREFCNL